MPYQPAAVTPAITLTCMKTENQLCILIVDDHKMVRDGLKVMIHSFRQHLPAQIEEADSSREALRKTARKSYDLVIMDYHLPDGTAVDTVLRLKRARPMLPVLALSNSDELKLVQSILDAGAIGYLLKNIEARELQLAIGRAMLHQPYFSNEIALRLLQQQGKMKPVAAPLTPREREVLKCILDEWKDDKIAAELGISKRTVQVHRSNLMQKLQVKNIAGLVKVALREGL